MKYTQNTRIPQDTQKTREPQESLETLESYRTQDSGPKTGPPNTDPRIRDAKTDPQNGTPNTGPPKRDPKTGPKTDPPIRDALKPPILDPPIRDALGGTPKRYPGWGWNPTNPQIQTPESYRIHRIPRIPTGFPQESRIQDTDSRNPIQEFKIQI